MSSTVATYADLRTRTAAEAHVTQMIANMGHLASEQQIRDALRADATEERKRTNDSPLPDADARNLGASLVLLTLNRIEGHQH
jgi:hypothetical protein